jgi:hypothetical protein
VIVLTREIEAARLRLRSLFRRDLAPDGSGPAEQDLESCLYEYPERRRDAARAARRVVARLDGRGRAADPRPGEGRLSRRGRVRRGGSDPGAAVPARVRHREARAQRDAHRERPVSVARVAVDLAAQIFESFAEKRALLVGPAR